jgi:hypothetical protein
MKRKEFSVTSGISPAEAAKATAQILAYYSTIPAMDPQQFAAGLTKTLSIFPAPVVALAVDPVEGIPAKVKFLNLAEIREHLDRWRIEYLVRQERLARLERRALPPPAPEEPPVKARVSSGFKKLSEHLTAGLNPLPPANGDVQ